MSGYNFFDIFKNLKQLASILITAKIEFRRRDRICTPLSTKAMVVRSNDNKDVFLERYFVSV